MRQQPPPLSFNDVIQLFRLCAPLQAHLDRGFDDHHRLNFEQVLVLFQIQHNEGECRESTATGIDEALTLRIAAKKHVAKLKELGLVEVDEESHWRDSRRKPLRLSTKGIKEMESFRDTWVLIAKDASLASLPPGALRDLSTALRELLRAPEILRRSLDRTQ